uniref:Uncharacterized protein n=1 Tax=Cyanoderma ruficeps TaxID=181631 RepID=A0A8C3NTE0_9PASS
MDGPSCPAHTRMPLGGLCAAPSPPCGSPRSSRTHTNPFIVVPGTTAAANTGTVRTWVAQDPPARVTNPTNHQGKGSPGPAGLEPAWCSGEDLGGARPGSRWAACSARGTPRACTRGRAGASTPGTSAQPCRSSSLPVGTAGLGLELPWAVGTAPSPPPLQVLGCWGPGCSSDVTSACPVSPRTHPGSPASPRIHPVSLGSPSTHSASSGSCSTHPVSLGLPSTHPVSLGLPSTHPVSSGPPSTHLVSSEPPSTCPAAVLSGSSSIHPESPGSSSTHPAGPGSPILPPPRGNLGTSSLLPVTPAMHPPPYLRCHKLGHAVHHPLWQRPCKSLKSPEAGPAPGEAPRACRAPPGWGEHPFFLGQTPLPGHGEPGGELGVSPLPSRGHSPRGSTWVR